MSKKHRGGFKGDPVTYRMPSPAGGVQLETFVPWTLVKRGLKKQVITPLDVPQEFLSEATREREARSAAPDTALMWALGLEHHWQRLLAEQLGSPETGTAQYKLNCRPLPLLESRVEMCRYPSGRQYMGLIPPREIHLQRSHKKPRAVYSLLNSGSRHQSTAMAKPITITTVLATAATMPRPGSVATTKLKAVCHSATTRTLWLFQYSQARRNDPAARPSAHPRSAGLKRAAML